MSDEIAGYYVTQDGPDFYLTHITPDGPLTIIHAPDGMVKNDWDTPSARRAREWFETHPAVQGLELRYV